MHTNSYKIYYTNSKKSNFHIIHYPSTFQSSQIHHHLHPSTSPLVCPTVKETTIYQRFSIQNSIHTPFYPHPDNPASFITTPERFLRVSSRATPSGLCRFHPSSNIVFPNGYIRLVISATTPFQPSPSFPPLPIYPSARSVAGVADRTLLRCRGDVLRIDVVHRVHSEFPSARYTNEFPAPRARNTITR